MPCSIRKIVTLFIRIINISAEALQKFIERKSPEGTSGLFVWYLQESNQGHKDFQSFALPTELRYQLLVDANLIHFYAFSQDKS